MTMNDNSRHYEKSGKAPYIKSTHNVNCSAKFHERNMISNLFATCAPFLRSRRVGRTSRNAIYASPSPSSESPRSPSFDATTPRQVELVDNVGGNRKVFIHAKAVVHGVSTLIDNLGEMCPGEQTVSIPPDIDVTIAQMYVDYVTLLTPPSVPTGYSLSSTCVAWRKVDDFFMGNVAKFPMDEWTSAVHAASPELWRTVTIDGFRSASVFNRDVFDGDKYKFLLTTPFQRADHEIDLDHEHCLLLDNQIVTPPKEPNWTLLQTTCNDIVQNIKFPWMATTYASKQYGIIFAGGRMVSALYDTVIPKQDIDIFIIASNSDKVKEAYDACIQAIHDAFPVQQPRAHSHYFVITQSVKDRFTDVNVNKVQDTGSTATWTHLYKFQIMHMGYPSPSHVVHGFDIDICGMLFDGKKVYYTKNAARAISNGFVFYNQNTLSTTAEARYKKYNVNYGLRILVAGISTDVLENVDFDRLVKFVKDTDKTHKYHDAVTLISCLRTCEVEAHVSDYDSNAPLARHFLVSRTRTTPETSMNINFTCMTQQNNRMFTGSYNPVVSNTLGRVHLLSRYI